MTQRFKLEYAPRRHFRPRRWLSLVVIVITVVAAPSFYRIARCLCEQYSYIAWQRTALKYEPIPGLLVYEDDRDEALKLLAKLGYRSVNGQVASTNAAWRAAGYLPEPLRNPKDGWVCEAYLHERQSQSGKQWLSMVGLQLHPDPYGRRLQVYAFSRPIIGWLPDFDFTSQIGAGGTHLQLRLLDADRLQIFAGKGDPADRSRATIGYDLNGARGTIEGVETDNGMKLQVLDGPLRER